MVRVFWHRTKYAGAEYVRRAYSAHILRAHILSHIRICDSRIMMGTYLPATFSDIFIFWARIILAFGGGEGRGALPVRCRALAPTVSARCLCASLSTPVRKSIDPAGLAVPARGPIAQTYRPHRPGCARAGTHCANLSTPPTWLRPRGDPLRKPIDFARSL